MTSAPSFLRLDRLQVTRRGKVAYNQTFHDGVNIIRGVNGTGKSTIADFIFYVLGGEFDDWKHAAGICDEVQAEITTPRGALVIKREIGNRLTPLLLYFGTYQQAAKASLESWEQFPVRRQGGRESFSQIMFRSIRIPEAESEGAANVTMHQILRLCYSDQRTPATRLFRHEPFDTQNIREAVGDLVCGISGYRIYEAGLQLREYRKELESVDVELKGMRSALPIDQALDTPNLIVARFSELEREGLELAAEISHVDDYVAQGEVREYLKERNYEQEMLNKRREKIRQLEARQDSLKFELREISEFDEYLKRLTKKLAFAEAAFQAVGSVEFTHCPDCGLELENRGPGHCTVCNAQIDEEAEFSRYNRVRIDIEIQERETAQLARAKNAQFEREKVELRKAQREFEKKLLSFSLKYSRGNGPRDAFLAERTSRIGHIEAEKDFLQKALATAEAIEFLVKKREELQSKIERLQVELSSLQSAVYQRRKLALHQISETGAEILRADLPRQEEFKSARKLEVDFRNDSISVDGHLNFAESSNVYLKNTAIFSIFQASGNDPDFFHPRFLLLDNIEDKGMEEARSHCFQRILVERVTEISAPHQIIFTTSMMNPDLELEAYTIGPAYTEENRTLNI